MKSKSVARSLLNTCPCGSNHPYAQCCEPLHQGLHHAATAEDLMRSRYCAYVLQLSGYVTRTWHSSTRPNDLDLRADTSTKWLGLKVIRVFASEQPNEAFVEFIAQYKIGGQGAQKLHETSRFVCEHERWYYMDGVFAE